MGQRHKHADVIIAWAEREECAGLGRHQRHVGRLDGRSPDLHEQEIPHQATYQEVQGGAVPRTRRRAASGGR